MHRKWRWIRHILWKPQENITKELSSKKETEKYLEIKDQETTVTTWREL